MEDATKHNKQWSAKFTNYIIILLLVFVNINFFYLLIIIHYNNRL